jgi:hypothetical protein
MPRLALSTSFGPSDASLPAIVAGFRELDVKACALHRHPRPEELQELAPLARRIPFVAVFGDGYGPQAGALLLVTDGGAAPEDPAQRERALEELCRRLHSLAWPAIALRTPASASEFPAPREIQLIREALPRVGYWHDTARGGEAHLEACGDAIRGASFDPFLHGDLRGLSSALGERSPAVVTLASGVDWGMVREGVACARAVFRD